MDSVSLPPPPSLDGGIRYGVAAHCLSGPDGQELPVFTGVGAVRLGGRLLPSVPTSLLSSHVAERSVQRRSEKDRSLLHERRVNTSAHPAVMGLSFLTPLPERRPAAMTEITGC